MEYNKSIKLEFSRDSVSNNQGAWFLGRFLYWQKTIKKSLIALDRTKRQLDKILGFFSWLIIFLGWASFFFWLFINQDYLLKDPLTILFFWTQGDILISVFLTSLWFDLYLIFKYSRRRQKVKRINYRFFTKEKLENKRYNIAKTLDDEAYLVLEDAFLLASKIPTQVDIIHFFRAALKNRQMQSLLIRLNVDVERLVNMVDRQIIKTVTGDNLRELAPRLQEVMLEAFAASFYEQDKSINILNIIYACLDRDKELAEILYELEVDKDKVLNTVAWFKVDRQLRERYQDYRRLSLFKPDSGMNRSYTAIATPTLDRFSHDLTLKAKAGQFDLCVGRQKEIEEIFENFIGGHAGVLLVGPHGVGKGAIIGGLAQMMVAENVPKFMKDKRLVEIDVSRIVSGTTASGAQDRLLTCISEANRSGNIIFYIDNIENLAGISAGSDESLDLSEVLSEAITRKHILCLATITNYNYSLYIENKALGTALTTVGVDEPDKNLAIQILESKVGFFESKYDVYIVYSALEKAVELSSRYLKDKSLPLKAINLLEKAAQLSAKNSVNNPEKPFCSQEDVALAIEAETGIPAGKLKEDEGSKLLNLETEIHRRMVDQEEAVKAVSASLRRARAALKDSKRPIASFLFLGPTGVGKTELAKAVSEIYFGSEDYMIRVDMSEYQHEDSVRKMIGDVDGSLGYLTEAVRKKPFSLILLDEVEKANPNILNLFLQLLDDGRLTDGQGRTISFAESIIIATSNIGAKFIQDSIKNKKEINDIKQELIDKHLRDKMRPELINRFDGIIVFKPLSERDIFKIATLMLKGIKSNLEKKGIGLKADKAGVMLLAKEGYDPKFGARPMRRLLQEKVEDEIANKILSSELKRRDQVLIDSQAKILVEKAKEL
ncbi:ATP-dependent Clp protease ATP-binding subunit [Candidatus Falkowbacteria bacterium]|nr:ATP-dependent Clp protease ATP-binding subunit [Candidatus Falkowbacteria bacterium]